MKKNIDLSGEELNSIPDLYKKMFDKFKEIESIPIAQWKTNHILGYFCKKYKEHYGSDYKFKFNTPSPSKSFEVFQVKRLSMILTSDPKMLVQYIDWLFDIMVPLSKRKLTSISFITNDKYVYDYKTSVVFNNNILLIGRTKDLPNQYKQILLDNGFPINTYGELSFLSKMEKTDELKNVFNLLESSGLDLSILDKVV